MIGSVKYCWAIFLILLVYGCSPMRKSDNKVINFASCPEGFRNIPLTKANWKTLYTGYGQVVFRETENQIYMAPMAAKNPETTHASLVLSEFNIDSDNFDLVVDYKNEEALRIGTPNTWELFWLMFNYVPGPNFTKTTNYVIAKINGIEVGRAAQAIDQVYVKEDDQHRATYKVWHRIRVQYQNGVAKFYFNDSYVFDVPSSVLFTAHGKIGLYTEDAAVVVRRVCLNTDTQLR